ncbi:MAG: hypothetical protein K2Q24_11175 [Chitinophagaceae bacterium]|nr:hypothetical protein [Chitinophagaceae bacterium]
MKLYYILVVFICLSALACEKKVNYNADITYTDAGNFTYVKFINAYPYATPSFASPANGPTVQLAYNGIQFSATPIALGGSYPTSPGYASVDRGIAALDMFVRMSTGIPPATVRDSFLFSSIVPFAKGKYYSYFFADSINNSNRRVLVTEDDIREPGGRSLYRMRFVNLLANMPSGTPTLDLYSARSQTVIFSGIPARGVTPFIELPVQGLNTPDTLQIRYAGSPTAIATLNTVALQGQISFTVFARGMVGATGTRAPAISTYRNR